MKVKQENGQLIFFILFFYYFLEQTSTVTTSNGRGIMGNTLALLEQNRLLVVKNKHANLKVLQDLIQKREN